MTLFALIEVWLYLDTLYMFMNTSTYILLYYPYRQMDRLIEHKQFQETLVTNDSVTETLELVIVQESQNRFQMDYQHE